MTTNYERYFGTPERAAETLARIGDCCLAFAKNYDSNICLQCPLSVVNCWNGQHIAKWLKEEADER